MVIRQLGEGFVETHDVASQPQAARAQGCLQQTEGSAALSVRHLLKTDALAHVEVLVHPLAPFRIFHREHGPVALLLGEAGQETFGGGADWGGRNAGEMDAEGTVFVEKPDQLPEQHGLGVEICVKARRQHRTTIRP